VALGEWAAARFAAFLLAFTIVSTMLKWHTLLQQAPSVTNVEAVDMCF